MSIGNKDAAETLRTALAMGADRAIHVTTELSTDQELQPLAVAKVFAAIAKKESPHIVLLGELVLTYP